MKVFQNRKKCGSNYLYLFTLSFYTHINWVYAIFRNSTPNMTKFDIKTCKLVFLLSLLKFQHPTQPKYQKKNQKSWTFQIKCKQIKNQLRKCFINKICQEIIRLLPILSRSPVKKKTLTYSHFFPDPKLLVFAQKWFCNLCLTYVHFVNKTQSRIVEIVFACTKDASKSPKMILSKLLCNAI